MPLTAARTRTSEITLRILAALIAFGPCSELLAQSAPPFDCQQWNEREFFSAATAESIAYCLRAGHDPNARNALGESPLHLVDGSGDAAVVVALIEAGADVNARDDGGRTPLHWVVFDDNSPGIVYVFPGPDDEAITRTLLDLGADVNSRDADGQTPLHAAAGHELPEVSELLLAAGADPKAIDDAGETPWSYAGDNEWLVGTAVYRRLYEGQIK